MLVSKYADHLPLYRQSQIFGREGLDLDRSTLADWVGKSTALLEPLADAIGRHVLSAEAIFADDTPVQHARTRHRQKPRPHACDLCPRRTTVGGTAPPAAWYRFSGDRKGQHPKDHLARFRGWMHADGYAGFEDLYRTGAIREVACMPHVRRKFVDIHRRKAPRSQKRPSAGSHNSMPSRRRPAVPARSPCRAATSPCRPVFDDLEVWLALQLTTHLGQIPIGLRHPIRTHQDGTPAAISRPRILELDNNAAERGMRAIALGGRISSSSDQKRVGKPQPSPTP